MSRDSFSVEERLRSSLVMCNTLKHCALLADETIFDGVSPFTPKEVLKLFPGPLDALVEQLLAVQTSLTAATMSLPAPASDGPIPIRLRDAVLAVAGVSDDTRAIELAEDEALQMVAWRTLLWVGDDPDYKPLQDAVGPLTDAIERAASDASPYLESRAVLHRLSSDNSQLAYAVAVLVACERRAAYYLGLARGWHGVQRLMGGAR